MNKLFQYLGNWGVNRYKCITWLKLCIKTRAREYLWKRFLNYPWRKLAKLSMFRWWNLSHIQYEISHNNNHMQYSTRLLDLFKTNHTRLKCFQNSKDHMPAVYGKTKTKNNGNLRDRRTKISSVRIRSSHDLCFGFEIMSGTWALFLCSNFHWSCKGDYHECDYHFDVHSTRSEWL